MVQSLRVVKWGGVTSALPCFFFFFCFFGAEAPCSGGGEVVTSALPC